MRIRKSFEARTAQRSVVTYNVRVAIGSSGAVGAHTGKGLTVTRTGTGDYTVTLADVSEGGVGAILGARMEVMRDDDAGYSSRLRTLSATAATFTVAADAALGTPADPPSGTALVIQVVVRDSQSDLT